MSVPRRGSAGDAVVSRDEDLQNVIAAAYLETRIHRLKAEKESLSKSKPKSPSTPVKPQLTTAEIGSVKYPRYRTWKLADPMEHMWVPRSLLSDS